MSTWSRQVFRRVRWVRGVERPSRLLGFEAPESRLVLSSLTINPTPILGVAPTGMTETSTTTSSGQSVKHPGSGPTVGAVYSTYGPTYGGTYVTITGTYFTSTTVVDFGGVAATGFSVTSSTTIVAKSPAESAGVVDITVTTPHGTSAKTGADHFTYLAPTLASISVSPSSMTLLDGAIQLYAATGLDRFGKAFAPGRRSPGA